MSRPLFLLQSIFNFRDRPQKFGLLESNMNDLKKINEFKIGFTEKKIQQTKDK